MSAVRLVKHGCMFAVTQIAHQMPSSIDLPLRISFRQVANMQSFSHTQEHIKQFALLTPSQWPVKERVSTLRIVNQHVEHVAKSPIRYRLSTLLLDDAVARVYSLKRKSRLCFIYKH